MREALGKPIYVSSGFRCPAVNAAVGGTGTSQHLLGCAADITCFDNKILFDLAKKLPFDQLIWEYGDDNAPAWVHISYDVKRHRRQVLRARKQGRKTVYDVLPFSRANNVRDYAIHTLKAPIQWVV